MNSRTTIIDPKMTRTATTLDTSLSSFLQYGWWRGCCHLDVQHQRFPYVCECGPRYDLDRIDVFYPLRNTEKVKAAVYNALEELL